MKETGGSQGTEGLGPQAHAEMGHSPPNTRLMSSGILRNGAAHPLYPRYTRYTSARCHPARSVGFWCQKADQQPSQATVRLPLITPIADGQRKRVNNFASLTGGKTQFLWRIFLSIRNHYLFFSCFLLTPLPCCRQGAFLLEQSTCCNRHHSLWYLLLAGRHPHAEHAQESRVPTI